jgi:hypothetical protein
MTSDVALAGQQRYNAVQAVTEASVGGAPY